MGHHKLCCFLTQRRKLPHFVSSTMEVQSFTCLKLQSAFPTVWRWFLDKAIFTRHLPYYYSQCKNLLKSFFFVSIFDIDKTFFCALYHLYRLFGWSTPQNQCPWPCDYHTNFSPSRESWPKFWAWQTNYIIEICEHGSEKCSPVLLLACWWARLSTNQVWWW